MNVLNLIAMAIGHFMMASFIGAMITWLLIEWPRIKKRIKH